MTVFLTKDLYFIKKIYRPISPFLVTSYFSAHPLTILLQILGDECTGVPHLKFWGPSPQYPTKSPPMMLSIQRTFPPSSLACSALCGIRSTLIFSTGPNHRSL